MIPLLKDLDIRIPIIILIKARGLSIRVYINSNSRMSLNMQTRRLRIWTKSCAELRALERSGQVVRGLLGLYKRNGK